MRMVLLILLGALTIGVAAPSTLLAQGRADRDERERDIDDRDDQRIVIRGPDGEVIVLGDDEVERRRPPRVRPRVRGDRESRFRGGRGNGVPAFCRTGEGHPVFGIQWCFDRRMRDDGIPAFCRTGEGHPVFGRRWCFEKGFGLGSVRGVLFGNDRVFLDLEGEDDVISVRRPIWERILGVLIPD